MASPLTPPGRATPLISRGTHRRFASARAIVALILREMATRYGRSPGGYVWAILEPLGAILVLSVGFSLVMRTPPLGQNFILFYASGFLPFSLYLNLSNSVARSINYSRSLLFYPGVTWADAAIARFLLNSLTGILVALILFSSILFLVGTSFVVNVFEAILTMLLAMFLGLGIGVLNCALMGMLPVWVQFWTIINRPLFIISGVIFLYDDMPAGAQAVLWYNPLIHITGLMRRSFYPTYHADYISIPFIAGIAIVCLFMGVLLMGRYHRTILHRGS